MLTALISQSVSARPSRRGGRRIARNPRFCAERLESRSMCNVDDGSLSDPPSAPPPEATGPRDQTIVQVPGYPAPVVIDHPRGTPPVVVILPLAPAEKGSSSDSPLDTEITVEPYIDGHVEVPGGKVGVKIKTEITFTPRDIIESGPWYPSPTRVQINPVLPSWNRDFLYGPEPALPPGGCR